MRPPKLQEVVALGPDDCYAQAIPVDPFIRNPLALDV